MTRRNLTAALTLSLFAGCASAPPAAPTPPESPEVSALRSAGIDRATLRCNAENRWGKTMRADAQAGAEDVMALLGPRTWPHWPPRPARPSPKKSATS